MRLSTATLPYDRSGPAPIVHLGVGAFARAHLGVYADDLLRAGHPALIRGVSLQSPRAEHLLGPQDGLYSLTVENEAPRIIGSFVSVATGPDAAVAAIAAAETTLVTLTITEKGYDGDAPAVVADGLRRRHDAGLPPVVVASLDNLSVNGEVLGERVGHPVGVRFPNSVVDRMVPSTTPAQLDEVEQRLGVRDEAAVVAEDHCSWIIEATHGLPPLAEVGVELVDDTAPYQRRKLWLLNGPHSALAYLGLQAGCETIADAAIHPDVRAFVDALVDDVLEVADVPDGRAFADDALRRFENSRLGHTCRQVAADGEHKLAQRILPVIAARRARGLSTDRLEAVVAAQKELS